MNHSEVKTGLIVTAKQTYYPIELSNAELLTHYETIQEYHEEISQNVLVQSSKTKPDIKLIDQQPEMNPHQTREAIVTFLYQLSVMTRVSNGIFFHAVRFYDRYCSKRVVLKDQAKLVVGTCLWLAAKTWGGCNHIINNVSIPTGGRFYGPNPRARIPRLSELVHYCGGSDLFDESMFVQMERHILDTLNWDVYEPMINDYILNVDENCLIQYELYKNQLQNNNSNGKEWSCKRKSQSSDDSDATVEEHISSSPQSTGLDGDTTTMDEDEELNSKIKLINLKRFLIDLSCWQYNLLKFELYEICNGMFSIINKFTNQDQGPFLSMPIGNDINSNTQTQVFSIIINGIVNSPPSLVEVYKEQYGIVPFILQVKDYNLELQKKLQLASTIDLTRKIAVNSRYFDQNASSSSVSSPSTYSSGTNYTPMRNFSAQSDNSVFSTTNIDHSSPITPHMYTFNQFKNESACDSAISVSSLPNQTQNGNMPLSSNYQNMMLDERNKENRIPNSSSAEIPQRAKFMTTGIFQNTGELTNRASSISLSLRNHNSSQM
ncbi:CLL_collapsed_G0042740.mRNA.1.CDS.1 [Saccharomyces cerevisiae]|uniref:G1/S-specific cyclin n=1 Tax=Saccharomyces cerevisiae (strain Kyokai no. 7 / NBRC 101557) TaxID=721032 RepID=G2WKQ5_YEASK|nr:CLN_G0042630.mRNA.1.CDS.1 [Saccharomyces cerevisiae]GAA25648.1 K7_Cln1p [Saccharomyces cerevisiae Kyokai no. 7]CAI5284159.1 CLL_HP2_G0036980.mRNA.1.CDS.1 [Saccharomyces cerevisiae]CAI6563223.1 CLL_HP2_G0036980.mRNA.1.CDS.1 [Saccharomyces cerevisiae]CAI6666364.1 CLL_HP1_G0042200.mRNA.1.CDS.1 [Saccharomyces cerevisiae]